MLQLSYQSITQFLILRDKVSINGRAKDINKLVTVLDAIWVALGCTRVNILKVWLMVMAESSGGTGTPTRATSEMERLTAKELIQFNLETSNIAEDGELELLLSLHTQIICQAS